MTRLKERGRRASQATCCCLSSAHRPSQLVLAPAVAGPYAARLPRKRLQRRTCSVSCDGGRTRTPQPRHRPTRCSPASTSQRRHAKVLSRDWNQAQTCSAFHRTRGINVRRLRFK
ncbi:UNVERIFIED_CONTAM: hypothetical protein EX528_16125 [Xanthomonas axonopodis]